VGEALPQASAEENASTTAGARSADTPPDADNLVPADVSAARLPPMPTPGGDPESVPAAEEFLEEDDATHYLPRPPDGHRIAPMRLPDKPIKPDGLAKPKAAAQGPSDAALRFMGWLQQGLANGSIAHNETGAMVHFAAEGMLLISPRIFRHFAERFGEKGDGTPSTLAEDKLGTGIQREVIKAGWHLLGPKKTNVHKYQVVRRNGKGGSQLSVMIIREPQRFIEPVPPANPHLVRSDIELEAKRDLD
jgi:hypothetical protein